MLVLGTGVNPDTNKSAQPPKIVSVKRGNSRTPEPFVSIYLPLGQLLHSLSDTIFLYFPGIQSMHAFFSSDTCFPASQYLQVFADIYFPGGHTVSPNCNMQAESIIRK